MKGPASQRYILLVTLVYALLALGWIFLSDVVLSAFIDIESIVWMSMLKGVFFVLVSSAGLYFALHAVPHDSETEPKSAFQALLGGRDSKPWPRWIDYTFAVVLVVVVLFMRDNMPITFGDRPLLIMFMLPIILAALLGGLGPGLVATGVSAVLVAYHLVPPTGSMTIGAGHDLFQWSLLLVNGLTVSLVSGAMHRARQRERARWIQFEATHKALLRSEERFRRLFHDAPVPMGQVGKDGIVLAQNERFVQVFGYVHEDMPTVDDWWRIAYPDPDYRAQALAQWNAAVERAVEGGSDIEAGEYRVTCKDGSERIVRISGIVMDGGALSTFFDVTDLRRAEAQLRLWAESFEHAQLGLVIVDARSNTVISANPAFADVRGFDREEMVGMPVRQLFPDDRVGDAQDMVQVLDLTSHAVFESEHMTKDGQRFPVLLDVTVLRDDEGRPMTRVAYALDLTERKRVERELAEAQAAALEQQNRVRIAALNQMQDANAARARVEETLAALRESEERLTLFIEHAPAALAMFDREMHYLAVSRRWLDDYALGEREVLGRSHYEIFPEIPQDWKDVHSRGLAGEVIRADEDRFERADGTFQWLRWEMRPWHTADNAVGGIVIFSEDITRHKLAEAQIRQLNAELEQRVEERTEQLVAANKELEAFSYSVSHDLRAPLRAISGFSRILMEDYSTHLGADGTRVCAVISDSARDMGTLIDDLLTFSRTGRAAMNRASIDMGTLVHAVFFELTTSESRERLDFHVGELPFCSADMTLVRQVWVNLLANAIKFSARKERAEIDVSATRLDDEIIYCIRDNGAGFDMHYASKLFGVFQRLHSAKEFEGTGVGLAIVQRIVQRHGGRIWAEAETDKGAAFYFTFGKESAA